MPRLAASRWPGLRAALKQLGLRGEIQARDVAFVLAPRLNAAGRWVKPIWLSNCSPPLRSEGPGSWPPISTPATRTAAKIQEEMLAEALTKVDPEAPAIVVADEDWHPGVRDWWPATYSSATTNRC